MPYSRAPGIPGNENDHSRIPGNEKTPPGMNSLIITMAAHFSSGSGDPFCVPTYQTEQCNRLCFKWSMSRVFWWHRKFLLQSFPE